MRCLKYLRIKIIDDHRQIRLSGSGNTTDFLASANNSKFTEKKTKANVAAATAFRLTLFGQRVSVSKHSIVNWWQSSRVMSDKRSDTIITLIGSVKNVGIIPHKNVDHATP